MKNLFKFTFLLLLLTCFADTTLFAQADPPMLQVEDQDADVANFSSATSTTRLNLNSASTLLNGSLKRAFIETDVDRLRFGLSSNNTNGSIRFSSWLSGSQTDHMVISNSGTVGIGTLSPGARLHVRAKAANVSLRLDSEGPNNYMSYYVNSTNYKGYSGIYTGNGLSVDDMQFGTGFGNSGGKTVLVCNSFPKLSVDASGNVEINESYTLPNADGSAGEVLTTDGAGNVSWDAGASGANIAFSAYLDGDLLLGTGVFIDVMNFKEDFDYGGGFNEATGVFTAPSSGLYSFTIKLLFNNPGSSGPLSASFGANLVYDIVSNWYSSIVGYNSCLSHTSLIELNAGQTIDLTVNHSASGDLRLYGSGSNSNNRSKFEGYKIR